jgi:hypothetical protein
MKSAILLPLLKDSNNTFYKGHTKTNFLQLFFEQEQFMEKNSMKETF